MKHLFLSMLLLLGISCESSSQTKLSPQEFKDKVSSSNQAVILDVRTTEEFKEGAIGKAINVNVNDDNFQPSIDKMDKNKTYFVYCLAGVRSSRAAEIMKKSGFKNVYDLAGGFKAWKSSKLTL